jgi:hypothetical protein
VQRSGFQLILRIPDNRQPIPEVERNVAALTSLLIDSALKAAFLGEGLHLTDELVPRTPTSSDIYVRVATSLRVRQRTLIARI